METGENLITQQPEKITGVIDNASPSFLALLELKDIEKLNRAYIWFCFLVLAMIPALFYSFYWRKDSVSKFKSFTKTLIYLEIASIVLKIGNNFHLIAENMKEIINYKGPVTPIEFYSPVALLGEVFVVVFLSISVVGYLSEGRGSNEAKRMRSIALASCAAVFFSVASYSYNISILTRTKRAIYGAYFGFVALVLILHHDLVYGVYKRLKTYLIRKVRRQ